MCIISSTHDLHNVHLSQLATMMHNLHMDISRFRKARGLSQRDLADMVGCDQSTIQRAEAFHTSAKIQTYIRYAESLDMDLTQLFSEDQSPVETEILKIFRRIPEAKHGDLLMLLKLAQETDPEAEVTGGVFEKDSDQKLS